MKVKPPVYLIAIFLLIMGTLAWADQIILKDGTVYSGKFIRGDAQSIDFQILGRVESFNVVDISKLVFEAPEPDKNIATPDSGKTPQASMPDAKELKPIQEKPVQPAAIPEGTSKNTQVSSITVPKGMSIAVRTTTEIDTDRNRVGDPFEAVLDEDLVSGTQTVAPRGSVVNGRIAYAQESGALSGQSQLVLELTNIVVKGKTYPMKTSDYTEVGSSRGKKTAATVGGTAALGAIIGAIAGGGKGAAIGAASGAAVGTGVQVVTRGQVLRIPAETVLEFHLETPLTVDVP